MLLPISLSLSLDSASAADSKSALPELEIMKEEKVSISARHEQPISEAASNVYVITDEDIRQSGATDLPTVLRRIPGVEVIQMTGADFDVSFRGNNQPLANKILILVDGRSIYEDIQGQVWWRAIPVTLPEIKRIEVLKGPASALYGFNAFDGVVNIITKSPDEMKGTTLQFGGGEFGTITSSAIQAGTINKLGYRLSVGRDQTNQWSNRDALAFRDHKVNAQAEYSLSSVSKLIFSGGVTDVNRFDGPVFDFLHNATKIRNSYANVTYERPNFFVRSYWQHWDHTVTNITDPRISRFILVADRDRSPMFELKEDSYNVEAQHTVEFGAKNRLIYGLNYRHNADSSQELDQFHRHQNRLGLYLQDEWYLTKELTFVAGLRNDLHTEINPTYSPRVALLYKPAADHTFRIAGSAAYRPPTMFESHVDIRSLVFFPGIPPFVPPSTTQGTFQGSTNLTPEKIVSYEAGYQGWFFRHRLRVRGDVFINHISDLITSVRVSAVPSRFTFVNNGTADIHGVEAGVEFLATPWLSGFANYSYEEMGQTFTVIPLRRGAPRDKVNLGLRAEWTNVPEWYNGVSGEVALHFVSSANYAISDTFSQFAGPPFGGPAPPSGFVDDYTLVNLRLGYQFWKDKAEVAISVFNTFNDKHKEHPLGETIGSRVLGWLTIRL